MKLEVISDEPKGTARHTAILFVHGAYGAAWIWEQHFLPYFAEHGYSAHALSLRGHGGSDGWKGLPFTRLRHYVEDLEQVAGGMSEPPVLVGHSMGGMVVQKYMHAHPLPAAVLMASVPPHGMVGSALGMVFTNPILFRDLSMVQAFGWGATGGGSVRKALFSDATPDETIRSYMPRMQPESALAMLDMMGFDLPPSSSTHDFPVLVLGAERDALIYRSGLEATAHTYGTQAEILPGMAHAMMLDHGWRKAADRILDWLDEPAPVREEKPRGRSGRRQTR